jgi:Ca2+-binding RTX toxin-like protein
MVTITGTQVSDILAGTGADDTILGLGGDDWIQGFAGADDLDGGDGFDFVSYLGSLRGLFVDLIAGAAWDGVYLDRLTSFEAATGSNLNDTIYGNSGANVIDGGGGADYLNGGDGLDTVRFLTSERGVTIDITGGQAAWDGENLSKLIGFENVIGSNFDDTLYGDASANVLQGSAGFDQILTGAGQDRIVITAFSDNTSAKGVAGVDGTDRVLDFTGSSRSFSQGSTSSATYGDVIDLSQLLRNETNYQGGFYWEYVRRDQFPDGADILVDRDGAGTEYGWQSILFLDQLQSNSSRGLTFSSTSGLAAIDDGHQLFVV